MGHMPGESGALKFDTIKTYITFIRGMLIGIKMLQPRVTGKDTTGKPIVTLVEMPPFLVRFENSNKTLYRKILDINRATNAIQTNNPGYTFPMITFKLANMALDQSRFGMSMYRFEADKYDVSHALNNVAKYMKTPVPYDFTFNVTMWSNLYSNLLDFIENFNYMFTPANTFTITLLESSDKTIRLLSDTVIYVNQLNIPDPPDIIDENTNEPIQSVTVTLILKGMLIPPLHEAKLIKIINQYFSFDTNVNDPMTEYANITVQIP